MKRFPIIKHAPIWVGICLALMIAAWIFFLTNFRPSIEFTGGVAIQLKPVAAIDAMVSDVKANLTTAGYQAQVSANTQDEVTNLLVSIPMKKDEEAKIIATNIRETLINKKYITNETDDIISLALNGPSISDHMKSTALSAVIIGILFVVIYMLFSFGSIRKIIPPATLTSITIATMIFDISIPAGIYGIAMFLNPTLQVDSVFIIAILTVMGYSINDTIIVLDRIRENMKKEETGITKGTILYGTIFEDSLWQTMRRSIGTSLSTFITVFAMYIFGSNVIKDFAFTMGIGILCGTASSIFLSTPAVYLLLGKRKKEHKKLK